MSGAILITLCTLLLIAYLFDLSASRTRIPSVVLLLLLGWSVAQATHYFGLVLPDLSEALQIIGTVGLIMIVLEGSLELEFNKGKTKLVLKSIAGALVPFLIISFSLAWIFDSLFDCGIKIGLINAIPLSVISSAIAIPSARHLKASHKEFITYESSFSDIIGVLLFNFAISNDTLTGESVGRFSTDLLLMIFISLVATLLLSLLLKNINHHIKFFPIIIGIILVYALAKEYHLPALLFILLFGLFLANSEKLKNIPMLERFSPEKLDSEVGKLKDLLVEATFMVRSLFFLLFGFLIETADVINPDTIVWAIGIMAGILILRYFQLKASSLEISPLVFIAPRGLITILLFLSINESKRIDLVNQSLVIQVILISAFTLMAGMMFGRRKEI